MMFFSYHVRIVVAAFLFIGVSVNLCSMDLEVNSDFNNHTVARISALVDKKNAKQKGARGSSAEQKLGIESCEFKETLNACNLGSLEEPKREKVKFFRDKYEKLYGVAESLVVALAKAEEDLRIVSIEAMFTTTRKDSSESRDNNAKIAELSQKIKWLEKCNKEHLEKNSKQGEDHRKELETQRENHKKDFEKEEDSYNSEITRLKNEHSLLITAVQKQLEQVTLDKRRLDQDINFKEGALAQMQSKIDALEKDLLSKSAEVKRLSNRVSDLEAQKDKLEDRLYAATFTFMIVFFLGCLYYKYPLHSYFFGNKVA